MKKNQYIRPESEEVILKVSDKILDKNFGNSDHVTVGGDDDYSGDDQGAKKFEDFSPWED